MIQRRHLLKALGYGAIAGPGLWSSERAKAEQGSSPKRIVFFVQPHGTVPSARQLTIPGADAENYAERSLLPMSESEMPAILRPLHNYRDRLLSLEGLAHTSVTADIAAVMKDGGDLNNHSVSVAGLLSGVRAMQVPGSPCTGGARTLDQELGLRTQATGRFATRIYGGTYVPNATNAPFSFLGPGQAAPVVTSPRKALEDLLGFAQQPGSTSQMSREDKIRALRGSVLDLTANDYARVAPGLGHAAKQKLDAHLALVRDLERAVAAQQPASCDTSAELVGATGMQFMRLIRMAFACDLTRVVTYVAPVPEAPEFGYPAEANVHGGYAHASVRGATSCGTQFSEEAERAMTDLSVFYAKQFAYLLAELDSVVEGSGTLLDHTTVVWLTELATPAHHHHDVHSIIAGGSSLRQGIHARYPQTEENPIPAQPKLGPAMNRLYVNLLEAMGQSDTSFGMKEARSASGAHLNLTGALRELRR